MCAWRESERHDSRLLADVEALLEELDKADLDGHVCVCSRLSSDRETRQSHVGSRQARVAYVELLLHDTGRGDGDVLAGLGRVWRNLNGLDLHGVLWSACIPNKSAIVTCQ